MNIFATSPCPIESAKYLDDKRVVKMVLESAQLLSTALTYHELDAPYKPTHVNHPCTKWVCSSDAAYTWLVWHFSALLDEYTARYHKRHKCQDHLATFLSAPMYCETQYPELPSCAFPRCMPEWVTDESTTVAYRTYLDYKWQWDKRQPTWYGETRETY